MIRFLFLIFLFSATIVHSQDWISIHKTDDGQEYLFRNHSENMSWVKVTNTEVDKGTIFEQKLVKGTKVTLFKFDCTNKKLGTVAQIEYDENYDVIRSNQEDERLVDMEYPYPDTFGEFILRKYCE